jgi:hypothetical protein
VLHVAETIDDPRSLEVVVAVGCPRPERRLLVDDGTATQQAAEGGRTTCRCGTRAGTAMPELHLGHRRRVVVLQELVDVEAAAAADRGGVEREGCCGSVTVHGALVDRRRRCPGDVVVYLGAVLAAVAAGGLGLLDVEVDELRRGLLPPSSGTSASSLERHELQEPTNQRTHDDTGTQRVGPRSESDRSGDW